MGIEQEAREGLHEYRSRLVDEFGSNEITGSVREAQKVLGSEGLARTVPFVIIPYEDEALERAIKISEESTWTDPFTAEDIKLAHQELVARDGEVRFIGHPTGLYSMLLDIVVLFDDYPVNAELYGDTYAKGNKVIVAAHESAHSSFGHPEDNIFSGDDETGRVKVKVGELVGRQIASYTLWENGGKVRSYKPVWIDEAVAEHFASKARDKVVPESVPAHPRTMQFPQFGVHTDLEVPQSYLIHSDTYPDQPGPVGGHVAAIGLDELEARRPGVLDQVKQLSLGSISRRAFNKDLINRVGKELHSDITKPRPYETWGPILKQIKEL